MAACSPQESYRLPRRDRRRRRRGGAARGRDTTHHDVDRRRHTLAVLDAYSQRRWPGPSAASSARLAACLCPIVKDASAGIAVDWQRVASWLHLIARSRHVIPISHFPRCRSFSRDRRRWWVRPSRTAAQPEGRLLPEAFQSSSCFPVTIASMMPFESCGASWKTAFGLGVCPPCSKTPLPRGLKQGGTTGDDRRPWASAAR